MDKRRLTLTNLKEVSTISQQHLLDTFLENNRTQRPLAPGVSPPPRPMRVGKIDVDSVFGICLVHLLGFENQLLQNRVVASNHTDDMDESGAGSGRYDPRSTYEIDRCSVPLFFHRRTRSQSAAAKEMER